MQSILISVGQLVSYICYLLGTVALAAVSSSSYATHHAAHHGTKAAWDLVASESKVTYGSIKKNSVGEVNHFRTLAGTISAKGKVLVNIGLASVETYIDIRNQRMIEHVFGGDTASATLSAQLDLATLSGLAVGATTTVDVEGSLALLGNSIPIETAFFVARLSDSRILAVTDEMIMVKTEALGVDASVTKLMELAKLPSITRVVPVSLRMVFEHKVGHAAKVMPAGKKASQRTVVGNTKLGKKVFRQCQACHQVKQETNSVGPHLVGIIGRAAGSVGGFAYSAAMKNTSITWTPEALAAFVAKPEAVVPGNSMPFGGISNPKDVQDLLAYLATVAK